MFKVGDYARYVGDGYACTRNQNYTVIDVSDTRFKGGQAILVSTTWSGRIWMLAKNFITSNGGPPPKTFNQVGLRSTGFAQCCGASIIHNFYPEYAQATPEELGVALRDHVNGHRRSTGMLLVVFNETQNRRFEKIILDCGFKLLTRHTNYNHGSAHWNYLYGFVCEDHKTPVREVAKAFG